MADFPTPYEILKRAKKASASKGSSGGDAFGYGGGIDDILMPRSSDQPIGVPEGYIAERRLRYSSDMSIRAAEHMESQEGRAYRAVPARYYNGAEYKPQNLSPSEIFNLQMLMVDAGILTKPFQKEIWDPVSAEAYREVLHYANANGLTDQQAILEISQAQLVDPSKVSDLSREEALSLLPIQQTDPETLKAAFRRVSMDMTGVGMTEDSLNQMVNSYQELERQAQLDQYTATGYGELQGEGGDYTPAPAPETFLAGKLEGTPEQQGYEARNYMAEASNILAGPGWGLG